MKKIFAVLILGILASAGFIFASKTPVSAAFYANNLISDGVFNNYNSMTASQIDAWLNNNFGSASCISTSHGFSAPDVIGYSPTGPSATGGFSYGGDVSAGTIIYHAAQVYGLNPQVILTTLEKEEGLVSGSGYAGNPACSNLRYTAAMGYLCTDSVSPHDYSGFELYSLNGTPVTGVTGTCTESVHVAGFSRQVIVASWQLKFDQNRSEGNVGWNVQKTNYPNNGNTWDNSDDPQSCYSHKMTQGFYHVCPGDSGATFDGLYSIDGTTVHMDTGPTAALYNYTPHSPGNQNFVSIFESWFGSTIGDFVKSPGSDGVYLIENGLKRPVPDGITLLSYSYTWSDIVTISAAELSDISVGAVVPYYVHFRDGQAVKSSSGGVYDIVNGAKRPFPDGITFSSYSLRYADAVPVSNTELSYIPDGAAMPYNAHYRDGRLVTSSNGDMYDVYNGTKLSFPDGIAFTSYSFKWSDALVISPTEIAMILSGSAMPYNVHYRDGDLVTADGNGVYDIYNGTKRAFPNGATFLSYGYKWSYVLNISSLELSKIPPGADMPPKQ